MSAWRQDIRGAASGRLLPATAKRAASNNLPGAGIVPDVMNRRRSLTPFFDSFRLSGFVCRLHEADGTLAGFRRCHQLTNRLKHLL